MHLSEGHQNDLYEEAALADIKEAQESLKILQKTLELDELSKDDTFSLEESLAAIVSFIRRFKKNAFDKNDTNDYAARLCSLMGLMREIRSGEHDGKLNSSDKEDLRNIARHFSEFIAEKAQ